MREILKVSIIVLLVHIQCYIGREGAKIVNNVIIGMILRSIHESLKRNKLWKEKFQVFE